MGRPKQDEELRAITTCVDALLKLDDGQQARALSYLGDRFMVPPLVVKGVWRVAADGPMTHDDDSDENESAPWPTELEPQTKAEEESEGRTDA